MVEVQQQPSAVQSDPTVLPPLFDDLSSSSHLRDHSSLASERQSISVPNQSRPTPLLMPLHHPRPSSRPTAQTQSSSRFSSSPSPPHVRPTPLYPPPHSAPYYQNQFASSATSCPPNMDRYSIANLADRYLRATDKYPHPLLDQRRMSEPTMYGNTPSGYPSNTANLSNARHHQLQHQYHYVPPQSCAPHSSPLRRPSNSRAVGGSPWKQDHHLPLPPYDAIELEEPLSPLNPTFSGGESPPSVGISGMMFGSLHDDYGPSPPGTGTSTSSNAPATHNQTHSAGDASSSSNSRQYSFVPLPGNIVKKRPRRRYDEIERLYQCSWPNCTKAYGTLNHLNAHITMQKHGPKRSPSEFRELRKQWRKDKKEEAEAEAKALDTVRHGSHQAQHPSHHHTSSHSMSGADYQSQNVYAHHPPRSVQPIEHLDGLHDPYAHQRDVYSRRSQRYGFASPHSQHSGISFPHSHTSGINTSNVPANRLPANSTLLTPLSGYGPSSMSGGPGFGAYSSYDSYHSDSRSRAGHGRSRSSHVHLGKS